MIRINHHAERAAYAMMRIVMLQRDAYVIIESFQEECRVVPLRIECVDLFTDRERGRWWNRGRGTATML
jgi:hypothetical protein